MPSFVLAFSTAAVLGLLACAQAGAAGKPRPEPTTAAAPADPPAKPAGLTVAVFGDALADTLADGLRDDLAAEPDFTILADTHGPSGNDDWSAAARALVATRRVDIVAIAVGAADSKPLTDGAATAEPGTPRWRTVYGERIAALVDIFRAKAIPVVWVGLPIVGDDQLAAAFAERNGIARERIGKAGVTYVDSWDAFADENGRFDLVGPDKDGRTVRLRTSDGRNFTKSGAIKLASFVEPMLRRTRAQVLATTAETTNVVLPSEPDVELDVNAEIRRELGLPALAALPGVGSPQQPGNGAAAAVVLTAPPVSPDGQLLAASLAPPPVAGTAESLAQRVLVEGRPIPPKPGRIDDFAWPRR